MKSTTVFYIDGENLKYLQASGGVKKTVAAVEVVSIVGLTDEQISAHLVGLIKPLRLMSKGNATIVIIPRSCLILRYMTLPSHQESEIRAMADLQVIEHIPYSREEVEIDIQVVEKTADGYSKVMAVVIPRETAMRYWKFFSDAKIPITGMTISSVGLWLLYCQQPDLPAQTGALVDLDVRRSEICLCRKEYWLGSRDIPVGLAQLKIEGHEEFLKQWELTTRKVAEQSAGEHIKQLYCVSTAGEIYGLERIMEEEQEGTVKNIALMNGLPGAKNASFSKTLAGTEASLAPLAGIAFSGQLPPVNLIPQSVRNAQKEKRLRREFIVSGIWGIAALIMSAAALSVGYVEKNIQIRQLEKKFESSKAAVARAEEQWTQVYESENMFRRRLIFNDVMQQIMKLLPEQVSLTSLAINNGNILSFQGVSPKAGDINKLQKDLVELPFFSNVNLDFVDKRTTQEGESNYFKITCTVRLGPGADEKTE